MSWSEWLKEKRALVGRCASCRFSRDGDLFGEGGLHCARSGKEGGPEKVKPVWSCEFFEYEPGAVE